MSLNQVVWDYWSKWCLRVMYLYSPIAIYYAFVLLNPYHWFAIMGIFTLAWIPWLIAGIIDGRRGLFG